MQKLLKKSQKIARLTPSIEINQAIILPFFENYNPFSKIYNKIFISLSPSTLIPSEMSSSAVAPSRAVSVPVKLPS